MVNSEPYLAGMLALTQLVLPRAANGTALGIGAEADALQPLLRILAHKAQQNDVAIE